MKVVVAEKISSSAIDLLREPRWTIVTPDQVDQPFPGLRVTQRRAHIRPRVHALHARRAGQPPHPALRGPPAAFLQLPQDPLDAVPVVENETLFVCP